MYQRFGKRAIDLVLSFCGLIVLLPLFLLIAIWIKADSPGQVFFRQRRVGKDKKEFLILKFRSMRTDTPKDMPTHLLKNAESYITRSGAFLRKTSLDELPQIINILKGEMSIVGPRPALYNQYDLLEERDKYNANELVPGLTGWAQINGRDELPIKEKAALDGYYAKHISFLMDLKCFFGTFAAVLSKKGIVEGAQPERKKILIITNHSYMLYRFRLELIQRLMEDSEVVLSMPFVGHEDDFQKMGLRCIETKIDRRGMNPIRDLSLMGKYHRQLKDVRPDLVLTFSIKPNIYAGFLCGKMRIPYASQVQGLGTAFEKPLLAKLVTIMYRTALKNALVVFFENEGNAKLFAEKEIVRSEKIRILPGAGINLRTYSYLEYPLNKRFRFIYIGRIMKEKGIDELFQACGQLKEKGYDFVLDLVGFYEDDYKEQVTKLIEKGIVVDHGFQKDPMPFYEKADCVVLPSYHEGMSNVLLEGAACGRPLITTDISGCREAVADGLTGLLVQVKDVDSLLRAMELMLQKSREERRTMGIRGRERMELVFDKNTVVEETVKSLSL